MGSFDNRIIKFKRLSILLKSILNRAV